MKKRFKKIILLLLELLLVAGVAVATWWGLTWWFQAHPPEASQVAEEANTAENVAEEGDNVVPEDYPKYLYIDSVGVQRAWVVALGLKAGTNQFDDPTNWRRVGWYNDSAKPGLASGGRMAGLYDGHFGAPTTVFQNLYKIAYGAEIRVVRGDDQEFVYRVAEKETVPVAQVDMAKMMQSAIPGKEGLNIITCAGKYDREARTYPDRLLVRAVIK